MPPHIKDIFFLTILIAANRSCSTATTVCRWLQRDFGVYVVNMFDTGQAARVLQLPGLGLKYLLQHFCGVQVRVACHPAEDVC